MNTFQIHYLRNGAVECIYIKLCFELALMIFNK